MHRYRQHIAAVVIGCRGVFQRIKRRIYGRTGALHMNAGCAIGGAVNKRQPCGVVERERAVTYRHISLHHVADDVRIGNGKCTDCGQAAVLGNSEGGRSGQHRWIVYAGYGELE